MERRTKTIIAGVAVAAAVGGGIGIAGAGTAIGGDDNEQPITGPALDQATAAALDFTGGGTVTETEVGDEESLYEVEVTLADGSQLDVQLDENFDVVGSEADEADDDDGTEGADDD